MELEGWLEIYKAVSLTAGAKERGYWVTLLGFLGASCLLFLAVAFLNLAHELVAARILRTVLAGIGLMVSLAWASCQWRLGREAGHWSGLLRGLEGEFAGAEFHRSAHRLLQGKEVCIPAADWQCQDWHPRVVRLAWLGRVASRTSTACLPLLFSLGWIAVVVVDWVL
ncbi:MAG: hypothetical protein ACP5G2_08500 [Candidatus Bipolaricaulaceae bacterium]